MARRAAGRVLYTLLALLLAPAMALLHLPSKPGRRAARDVTNLVLTELFRGRLHVGEITELDPRGRLVATGLTLADPEGRTIVTADRLQAAPVGRLVWTLLDPWHHAMPRAVLHVNRLNL